MKKFFDYSPDIADITYMNKNQIEKRSKIMDRVNNLVARAKRARFEVAEEIMSTNSRMIRLSRYDNSFTYAYIVIVLKGWGRLSARVSVRKHGNVTSRGFGQAQMVIGTFEFIDKWAAEAKLKAANAAPVGIDFNI